MIVWAAKLGLPQHVRQHRDVILARCVLTLDESASEGGAHAVDIEVVRRDAGTWKLHRLLDARKRDGPAGAGRHEVEAAVFLLPVEKVEGRDAVAPAGRGRLEHAHDAVGFGIRQRLEEDGVDEAEDGGVGPEAECEARDGDERETGAL